MIYKTAAALEMAIKEAAKASPQDTNRALAGFYFHRLLCRIFADDNDSFVLKGGQGVLARTLGARATRDIDLLSTRDGIDAALAALRDLAQQDLGDFIFFEYDGAVPIKADDEYRDGMTVKFIPVIGAKRMQPISIDLVVDEVPLDGAELLTPADRIDVRGLEACDYLVYPVAASLADKLCALLERHNGRASSRVKDLVDIIVLALTCDIDGFDLHIRTQRELSVRRLAPVEAFALPVEWGPVQAKQYAKLCLQTDLPEEFRSMNAATNLAERLFDPVLGGKASGMRWCHERRLWVE